jgi:hypothetical protein
MRHTLTAVAECLYNGTDAHPPITAYRTAEARWWAQQRPPLGAAARAAMTAATTHGKAA